jgi:ABC-type sugar transport system substrate-binding protein
MLKLRSKLTLGVVLAAVALTVAACGSSSSNSSKTKTASSAPASTPTSTPAPAPSTSASFTPTGSGGLTLVGSAGPQNSEATSPLGIKAETGAAQQTAIAAADAQAAKLGVGKIPAGSTVGLEEIINSVPSAQRANGQLEYALRELGIKVIPCDGAGSPTTMATCMTSLVAQGVKVIADLGTDPSLIAQGLADAKSHHIPVIGFSGTLASSPLFYRVNYNNDSQAGKILGQYMVSQLKAHGGSNPTVWISNYPASWAADRTVGVVAALKAGGIKIAAQTTVDSTNPIAGTQQQVATQYTQNPGTRAYYFAYDAPGAAAAQALAAKDGGKPFPAGPLVVTFHDDQQANGLIAKGQITAVADEDYDASSFETADQIAQFLAGKPVPPSDTGAGYNGHLMNFYPIINKANNPAAGSWPKPGFDVVSYFTELWHKEFGLH